MRLDKKRPMFLAFGCMVSMLFVVCSFEWKSSNSVPLVTQYPITDMPEDPILPTIWQPPKPPKPIVVAPVLIPVDNKINIDDQPVPLFDPDTLETIKVQVPVELPDDPPDTKVWTGPIEKEALPAGGYRSFYQFIATHLRYPKTAINNHAEGKVFVQFIVDKTGELTDIQIIRGIGFGCDKEALRVMKLVPRWNPGKQRGHPVRVRMIIPITFKLE